MLHIPNIEITLYVDNTTNHKCFTQWWDWERFAHNNKLSLIIKSTAKKKQINRNIYTNRKKMFVTGGSDST